MHVYAARFPDSPLSLRFGRAGAHVKSFRWVIRGRPCQLVQVCKTSKLWCDGRRASSCTRARAGAWAGARAR